MIIEEYIEDNSNGVTSTPSGFDAQYNSFVDYILTITEEIWEKRAIWVLYDTYAKDIIIHTGAQTIVGFDKVVHGTLKTLYAFPDRNMQGEAVIWAHYQDTSAHRYAKDNRVPIIDENRFFSSHRISSHATNLGDTQFGKKTGIKVQFRTIADCLAKDNIIYREWLVRDNLSIVQQLGFDPVDMAKKDERYKGVDIASYSDACTEIAIEKGNFSPQITMLFECFKAIWIARNLDALDSYYHVSAISFSICNTKASDNKSRKVLFQDLLQSFPDASARLDQCTCTYYNEYTEIALRWRLVGTHTKQGAFGEPSNKAVNILGINHYVIDNNTNKINTEWMVYDAFDVLCQIHSQE